MQNIITKVMKQKEIKKETWKLIRNVEDKNSTKDSFWDLSSTQRKSLEIQI